MTYIPSRWAVKSTTRRCSRAAGGGSTPPWWALAIGARLLPSLRSRCRAARYVVDSGTLDGLADWWQSEWRAEFEAEISRHLDISLPDLDDHSLLLELDALLDLLRRGHTMHFRLA